MNDAGTPKPETPEPLMCSFCLKRQPEVGDMIKGRTDAHICADCVLWSVELLMKRPKE